MSQVLVASSRAIISTAPCCAKKLLCKKYALLKKSKQPKMSPSRLVHQLQPPCWSTEQHRQSQTQHIDKKSWYTVARKIAVQQLRGKLRYRSWDENCRATALPRVGHGLTLSQGRILEQSRGRYRVIGCSRSSPREAQRCTAASTLNS